MDLSAPMADMGRTLDSATRPNNFETWAVPVQDLGQVQQPWRIQNGETLHAKIKHRTLAKTRSRYIHYPIINVKSGISPYCRRQIEETVRDTSTHI